MCRKKKTHTNLGEEDGGRGRDRSKGKTMPMPDLITKQKVGGGKGEGGEDRTSVSFGSQERKNSEIAL